MRSAHSPRSFVIISLFLASVVLVSGQTVRGQATVGPQVPAGPALSEGPQQDSKKSLSPADQTIKDAFQKSKNAATIDDFSAIVSLCQDGLMQGATGESAAYAKKLQAWR